MTEDELKIARNLEILRYLDKVSRWVYNWEIGNNVDNAIIVSYHAMLGSLTSLQYSNYICKADGTEEYLITGLGRKYVEKYDDVLLVLI